MTQVAPIDTTPVPPPVDAPLPIEAAKPPMVTVKLTRHYHPIQKPDPDDKTKLLPPEIEIVGHWKDEIKVKNAAGQEVVVQKREFIKEEVAPPKLAGTGFADKLWAGTVIKVTKDEAKYIRAHEIGTVEVDDD